MSKRTYSASEQAIALKNKLLNIGVETGKRMIADMLVTLYSRQEEIERACGTALYKNFRGFNKADSKQGVEDAEYIIRTGEVSNEIIVRWMSPERGSSKIAKYWKQFIKK